MDQGGSESDRKTTQQIRQAVVKDSSLSFTAKNVKIITITEGDVARAGQDGSGASGHRSGRQRVAGDAAIDNQLEVKK